LIVAAPPIAMMVERLWRDLPGKNIALWLRAAALKTGQFAEDFGATDAIGRLHLASAGAAALLVALFYAPNAPAKCRAEYDVTRYPAKAIEVLRQAGSPKIIFADDEWGDYLIYRLYPSNKVFVDGRSDFYGSAF